MLQDPKALREQVQNDIVTLITNKLASGEMTEDRAKEIAKLVLELLPENIDRDKLLSTIPKLDDHFQELSIAVVPIMLEYEKQLRAAVEKKLQDFVKQGRFDLVLELTKQAIEKEKELA